MSEKLIEISKCEVCGSQDIQLGLNLGSHPMCDDLVKVGDSRRCKEYPIEILYCATCVTAHQRFQIPKKELFPKTYHYRSRHTNDVLNGMKQLVSGCEAKLGSLEGKKVLDIGCNDGSLLSFFRERGASTFGIEPTDAAMDAGANGHHILNQFFDEVAAEKVLENWGQPDIITFTNVFAHIENLHSVIDALKLLSSEKTVIVIENHYFGAVLEKKQFDTFYHEHPRTYSATSFSYIAKSLGMKLRAVEFPSRYGGNIRVFLSSTGWEGELAHLPDESQFCQRLVQLADEIETWKVNKTKQLKDIKASRGKVAAKAFPGRSAIPVKILNLDENTISAVYEKPGSGKIGYYVPGTRIPILSDDEFPKDYPADKPLLNLAWHISDEIETYLRGKGLKSEIVPIISSSDFRAK